MALHNEPVRAVNVQNGGKPVLGLPISIQKQILRRVCQVDALLFGQNLWRTAHESGVRAECARFHKCRACVVLNPVIQTTEFAAQLCWNVSTPLTFGRIFQDIANFLLLFRG